MKQKIVYIITVVFSVSIGVIGTLFTLDYLKKDEEKVDKNNVEITESDTIKPAIDKIYDAVVLIETYDKNNRALGSGTGFVYKTDNKLGYVLTNHHVVSGASTIRITLSSGEEIEAKYLGSDEFSDVAVLSIAKEKVIQVAALGNSSASQVGDTLFTVGSPLGSEYMGSVTKGILSGKDRQISVEFSGVNLLVDVVQTDAAINPGNSGGPLVNMNGEVIGITSLKLVQEEVEGMGFALPIEFALAYTERLEKGEKIVRPMLGVQLTEVTNTFLLYTYRIQISPEIKSGVALIAVEKESSAEKAGLQAGDVITKINDSNITDSATFRYNLYKYSVGDTIEITYIRDSKEMTTKVQLTEELN